MEPFIAVDWGTTNRRAYLIDESGRVARRERDDRGIVHVAPDGFADEVAALRDRLGDRRILCAGMVGSNRGWSETPYVRCPAGLDEIGAALRWVEPGRTAIVPGLIVADGPLNDVMRGEEVQCLGAVATGAAPPSGLLCQPGTHCKWIWTAGGRVERFATAMTGEMFALLRDHSLLAPQLGGRATTGGAFRAGVEAAADGQLLSSLFRVRADLVSGSRAIDDAASYVSGLLIGHDVRGRVGAEDEVHVIADADLGGLYRAAIDRIGGRAMPVDAAAAFVGGMTALWRMVR